MIVFAGMVPTTRLRRQRRPLVRKSCDHGKSTNGVGVIGAL
jgi:hypothetical protein